MYVRFGTIRGFRRPLGSWNVSPQIRGTAIYIHPSQSPTYVAHITSSPVERVKHDKVLNSLNVLKA